jgi:short-subunit dehydrogenase
VAASVRRAALITGASAGIGLAIAHQLALGGFDLTVAARRAEGLKRAADELGEVTSVRTTAVDAADPEAVAALVREHMDLYHRLDVAVANAGSGRQGTAASTRAQELASMLSLNVAAPFALAREALPALRAAGSEHRGAWFIVTASISGVTPTAGFAGYSASKAAAISLARSITREEADSGVRACALCPAFVDTAMSEWTHGSVPPASMLRAADVAAAVPFLLALSPNALVEEIVIGRHGAGEYAP